MNIGILLPGFSSDENDWAIPVQLNLVYQMANMEGVRVLVLRYPHRRDVYSIYGAKVHSLGAGQVRGIRRVFLWIDALSALVKLHQQQPFDVLHAMWADETGLIAAWAGRLLRVPVVVSIAGGELVGFDDIDYGLQRSTFSRWIVRQAIANATCIVVACEYTRQLLGNVPEDKIKKIVLGVDAVQFSPAHIPKASRHLVHVASLVGVKDQQTLLRAVARLPDVTLDIVGEGPERARLEQVVEDLQITSRVRFCGAVHHLETSKYYQQGALHILTSRHEGLGMATLEAASCGIPSISTNVGLLPDDPQLGVTVPVGDDLALSQAIATLLNDASQYQLLRESSRQAVLQRYTIHRTVSDLRLLYQDLVKNFHN